MNIKVELNAVQTMEEQIEKQCVKCDGTIKKLQKGTVIEFKSEEMSYQIVVLKNKILIDRNNQRMIFELDKKTNTILETEYGKINMQINTNKMEVIKEECITYILLSYEIELEEQISYQNDIELKLSYNN